MTTTFAPIAAKNISDLGIPSDLCSVEITGSDIRRISVSSVDTRPIGQEEPNDRMFPDTSEVLPSLSHGFIYALEACLVNLKRPSNVFICLGFF